MLYKIDNVSKIYGKNSAQTVALDGISAVLEEGRFTVILGASGSGKSTFLNLIGGMDLPTTGEIYFKKENITKLNPRQLTAFRKQHIGFVFQSYNLLSDLTAVENVEFSTEIAKLDRNGAKDAMALVGLSDRLRHYPAELSGGEQQRVSIARAIAKKPEVLLCDEPTGALDFKTGIMVLEVLKNINRKTGTTVILITHNREIAKIADIVVQMNSGKITEFINNEHAVPVSEIVW